MTCFQVLIFNYIWKNIVDFWVERTVIFKLVSTSECIKDLEYNCNYPNSIPYKLRKLVLKKSIPYLGIKKNQNCSGIFFYGSLKVLVGLFILSSSRIFWLIFLLRPSLWVSDKVKLYLLCKMFKIKCLILFLNIKSNI